MSDASQKACSHCPSKELRRVNRKGYLQRVVLPKFGLFPWECVMCRHRYFFRDDGHRAAARGTADR